MQQNVEPGIQPINLLPSRLNRGASPDKIGLEEARILRNCDILSTPGRLKRGPGYVTTQVEDLVSSASVTACLVARRRDGKLIMIDSDNAGSIRGTPGDGTVPATGPLPTWTPGPVEGEDGGVNPLTSWTWAESTFSAHCPAPWTMAAIGQYVDFSGYFLNAGYDYTTVHYALWQLWVAVDAGTISTDPTNHGAPIAVPNVCARAAWGQATQIGGYHFVANSPTATLAALAGKTFYWHQPSRVLSWTAGGVFGDYGVAHLYVGQGTMQQAGWV